MANFEFSLNTAKEKILKRGYSQSFINTFERLFKILAKGESPLIRESDVEPVREIPDLRSATDNFDNLTPEQIDTLNKTAIIKLNGGLGTTMGLNKAKSLLKVKGDLTFLDIIVKSVLIAREKSGARLPLIFMNSFRTSSDTENYLSKFGNINAGTAADEAIDFEIMQHSEPKLRADNLAPVEFEKDRELEWCPPGHGDFYCSLYDSGVLHQLIEHGYHYAFVSNADNLGARINAQIASHFAKTGATIMLELADKTDEDIKGGHIVKMKSNGHLVLREVAQIHEDDLSIAFDLLVHPYFNTNSIWIDLVALEKYMQSTSGVVELPLIRNAKTVDPTDKQSTPVIQIETAIGAGINVFEKSAVINVSRTRFRPVKTNDDLEKLRSDSFKLDENFQLVETK